MARKKSDKLPPVVLDGYRIDRVYSGRPGCGCGCRGTYTTASWARPNTWGDNTSDATVRKIAGLIAAAIENPASAMAEGGGEPDDYQIGVKPMGIQPGEGGEEVCFFFEGPSRYRWAYGWKEVG